MTKLHTVHIIVGPTASGKSSYALDLAATQNGVIINADSMQIYDALPVLTAQPPAEDRQAAPHKLYSALLPSTRCTPQKWREMAVAEIRRCAQNDQTPIITGGTGLYIKALTEGFSPIPDVPDTVRQDAMTEQKKLGNPAFHEQLTIIDPAMAARLNPNDTQRLVRAWEVFKATGKSLAHWQSLPPSGPPTDLAFDICFINPPRPVLHERCNMRFDHMLNRGILNEISVLKTQIETGAVPTDVPITNALGYHALCAYLDGDQTRESAVEKAKAQTRQYAKRQITWFKRQLPDNTKEIK